ncbi:MAG: DUF1127 domain-containing protein [Pseudomonadota bacterium]
MTPIETSKANISLSQWLAPRSLSHAIRSWIAWVKRVNADYVALKELSCMSEEALADIGLCRSDLTLDGLTVASIKRSAAQSSIALHIDAGPAHEDESAYGG